MTWRRSVVPVLLGVGLLAGCSEGAGERAADRAADQIQRSANDAADKVEKEVGQVDWGKYGDGLKRRLDGLAERADCRALRRELAKREADDTELTRYIKRQVRRAC